MSELNLYRNAPIVTGSPALRQTAETAKSQSTSAVSSGTFQSVFSQALQKSEDTGGVAFSKHAAARMQQRSICLNADGLERLNRGVELARQKGLDDTLILMDKEAFVVSAQNKTVITAVDGNELTGNVFTNIDGTVVI
ncbi:MULTISPECIES: TIGR02530 family flagellar biosynthesis protein [Caproicibacterium]|uniref:TIGR02530 family flagellar biosynthesis protein n=1 Tax=Caproicibacterium argilliputei TaxID=3030016 RepID=A0AA97D922_9FIRM|nr:TIGR02530 family flagellar biosynthesis protein [Caproicibacterium argilliputei]WOC31268.1 TIGR02530 family flagellar biosynthesis protein [Caproicibacterium argilliputei]